ncbi:uncharacterized protein LOC133785243 [Humulus lupulus]|uniref:uncharacterized protein LOC133785243 n=1 Tax=Humulus lupulus TaxID=3486 RepID=UPI002B405AEB|nr:uncharacterized protein LOC133785243 [Humulus lupulus]
MAEDGSHGTSASDFSTTIVNLLHKFLAVQQRRIEAYSNLKRRDFFDTGDFGSICFREMNWPINSFAVTLHWSSITALNKLFVKRVSVFFRVQVIEMESLFQNYEYDRVNLAKLLRSVQEQEKQKLNLTVTLQVLKKAGRPSERLVSHADCKFEKPMEHECVHVHEITEAGGTEEAEADAMYDKELKEAIRGVQDAVTTINEHLEE